MILLDTHVLIWLTEGLPELGREARRTADAALADGGLAVSAITFWEIAMLAEKGRIHLRQSLATWRLALLEAGLREIPITGEIGIEAVVLSGLHPDPADRLIISTASTIGATLVTADGRILAWDGPLRTQDARI